MSDFDDDDFDFDDAALIQTATQAESRHTFVEQEFEDSPRAAKRRRIDAQTQNNKATSLNVPHLSKSARFATPFGPSEDQIERLDSDNAEHDSRFVHERPEQPLAASNDIDHGAYDFDAASDDIPSSFGAPQIQANRENIQESQNTYWGRPGITAPLRGLRQTTLFGTQSGDDDGQAASKRRNWPAANRQEPPTHHKLELEAAKTWIYPTNLGKIRDYQFNIVARGLYHNLLVALPTGLGKTFIAATIMLNWYRWTKDAQIVFVAPTKPLVAQQVDACFHIAGIPYSDTVVLTGDVPPALREDQWSSKRVFFMTPQTLHMDLTKGIADPKRIVLLVVDEAHRATGGYAYVEVVKFIRRFNESFRVLALTATPGGNVEAVQQVIDGLDISRVEIRTDQSLDLREYIQDRDIEKEVFKWSDEMVQIMNLYSKAVRPLLQEISGMSAALPVDPLSLTPFGCTQALKSWMASSAGRNAHFGLKGKAMAVFTTLASVAHGMDLLKFHGLTAAYHSWTDIRAKSEELGKNGKAKKSKWKDKLLNSASFIDLMNRLEVWTSDPEFIGHPKLAYLRQVILNHLLDVGQARTNGDAMAETRIMVFSSFRDSAEEIAKCLARTSPMIKPHVFVGQASSKGSKGMNQKKQLDVVEKFKAGHFNVLVATSIGEEGLDIGEVDMIICYDSKASPLRMLQRMGRTGRKRSGKVVLLQMEGKEENDWLKAKDSYQHMQKEIANGDKFTFHDDRSRRILPRELQPVVDKCRVEIPVENTQHHSGDLPTPVRKRKKASKKKYHMPDGVETGFITAAELTGGGKRNNKSNSASALPEDETEPVPYLDAVCLNDAQVRDFEQRYGTTSAGQEDSIISAPSLDRYPKHQRKLTKTSYVGHSRVSRSFVSTMREIADNAEYLELRFKRSLHEEDLEPDANGNIVAPDIVDETDVSPAAEQLAGRAGRKAKTPARQAAKKPRNRGSLRRASSAKVADESSPPRSDPAYAYSRGDIDLGSRDTPPGSDGPGVDYTSDLDGFIVGSDETDEEAQQNVNGDEDEDDLELPSSFGLSNRGSKALPSTQVRKARLAALLDEDSDDECARLPMSRPAAKISAVQSITDTDDAEVHGLPDSSLPSLSQLMASTRRPPGPDRTETVRGRKRRARKVVDDDDSA